MDDKTVTIPAQASCRLTWRRVLVSICILISFILAVGYFLRSSLYLKVRLTPKLAELGETMGGDFEFESIHAMGLTGIIFDRVKFIPAAEGMEPLMFESVTVYPDLPGMFVGDLNASLVEVSGLNASIRLENEVEHAWLKALISHAADEKRNVVVTSVSELSDARKSLPRLVCESCSIAVSVGENQRITAFAKDYSAKIESGGTVSFDGEPVQLCYHSESKEPLCFYGSLGPVHLGDSIQIERATLTDLVVPGGTIHSLKLKGIEFAQNEQRNVLFIEQGQAEASLETMTGRGSLSFTQFEMLHERLAHRLGVGFVLRESSGGTARVFGGYAPDENKLAITFDSPGINLATFVKKDLFDWLHIEQLTIAGSIHGVFDLAQKRTSGDFDVQIESGDMSITPLSSQMIRGIRGRASFKAWADWENHLVSLEQGTMSIGEIPCQFNLSRLPNGEDDIRVIAGLGCSGESSSFIPSLPEGFAPALSGYKLEGPYSFQIDVGYDEKQIDDLVLNVNFDLDKVQTLEYDPRSNFNLIKGDAFQVRVNAATVPIVIGPREKEWVRFQDLPRETAYAFVASEDGRFFTHPGFDIRAIRSSLIADLKADKIVRGGSTISQQVVKNLFLNHDKTAARKFQEAFLTWQMERTLPKMRIFEIYLNLAHWAKDKYGIRAAADYYFQKKVSDLTLRESLFLAAILPNPIIFGRQYAEGKLSESRLTKMVNVGTALKAKNRITEESWNAALPLIKQGIISDRPKPQVEP